MLMQKYVLSFLACLSHIYTTYIVYRLHHASSIMHAYDHMKENQHLLVCIMHTCVCVHMKENQQLLLLDVRRNHSTLWEGGAYAEVYHHHTRM